METIPVPMQGDEIDDLMNELGDAHKQLALRFGADDPLPVFILSALKLGDITMLRVAKAAVNAVPATLNGWTITEPDEDEKRRALLEGKPLRQLVQVDCIGVYKTEDEDLPVMMGLMHEPRRTPIPIRVQILAGTEQDLAVRWLRKVANLMESGWQNFTGVLSDSEVPF